MIALVSSSSKDSGFFAGLRDAAGMLFGALLFGLLFGSAAVSVGLDLPGALAFSALVFAGTAQFAALALWAPEPPLVALAIAAAMATSRLTLQGLSLGPVIRDLPAPARPAGVFLLNDVAWALTLARFRGDPVGGRLVGAGPYYMGVSAPIYAVWVSSTAVGFFTAGLLDPVTAEALAFAGVVFLAILVGIVVRGVDAPKAPIALSAVVAVALDGRADPAVVLLAALAVGLIAAVIQVGVFDD
jgi:predicted branched-subunit amino acid permease